MVYNFSSFRILPGVCVGCERLSQRDIDLCLSCEDKLSHNTRYCGHCALPLYTPAPTCGRCQNETTHFNQALSRFVYEGDISTQIHAFKYHQKLAHGRVLSELLVNSIQARYKPSELPDVLVPVPLHWQKLIRRGYNQAHEISRILSHRLNIPIQHNILQRVQRGLKQSELSRKHRLSALKGVFAVSSKAQITGKHIALIDDVMTTGATASTLAALLKQAGCNTVDVWTLARTPVT